MARQGITRHKMVSSGRLTGSGRGKPNKKNVTGRRGWLLEPAYSLYSTDSEDQVTTVHKGLDRCAALLNGILQAEKSESKPKSQVPKTASSKPRSKQSHGKMEAERKRLGKASSSVARLTKRPAPVQKTVLSSQSCPGLRGQPCFQSEQHPPAVHLVTGSEVKPPGLDPLTQTEHVHPHSLPLCCQVSGSSNGVSSTGLKTSTVFNGRLATSTPVLSPQMPASVPCRTSHAGSDGETRPWAISAGASSPCGALESTASATQHTASLSVPPAAQQHASEPTGLPLASSVSRALCVGPAPSSLQPRHPPAAVITLTPSQRTLPNQPKVHPHPHLVRASSQEQQLSSGETSEESGGCTSEEDEFEGVDMMPVRDTSCQTSMDRRSVMLSQNKKSPSPEKTARKVMTVKYLLGELKTLVANQDSEAVRLISEVEESVSLLPAMVGSTNVQAELALALQPLRSENVQLRRRLRILNQQLLERERAERQARPLDCDIELVSLQSLNFTLQTQLNDSQRDLGNLQQENERLRQVLEDKEHDLQHSREQCELETSRVRMDVIEALDEMRNCQTKLENLERENTALTHSLQQREAEITRLQEIIGRVQKSPTRDNVRYFAQTDESKPSSQLTRSVLDLHESQQEETAATGRAPDPVKVYLQTLKTGAYPSDPSHPHPQPLSLPTSGEKSCRLREAQATSAEGLCVHRAAQPSAGWSWTQEGGPRGRAFVPLKETQRLQGAAGAAAGAQKGGSQVEGSNTHVGLNFLGLDFEKLGISSELPCQDLKVLDEREARGFPSQRVIRTTDDAVNVSEKLSPARRCLRMGDDAPVYLGRPSVLESTLSLASDYSVNSCSTFNTCKEQDFRNGLAALDASIANLQRTLKADLKI